MIKLKQRKTHKGILSFDLNGEIHSLRGDFKFTSKVKIKTCHGVKGYSQIGPYCLDALITDRGWISIKDLNNINNTTLVLNLPKSKTIVMYKAYCDLIQVNKKGNISVKFTSMEAELI